MRALPDRPPVGAIVLTGGASRRMGRHKPALTVGGAPMVERVLRAAAPLVEPGLTVVVGSPVAVPPGVPVCREDPPGSGPVAAVAAGLAAVTSLPMPPTAVLVLAADLPWLSAADLRPLVERVTEASVGPDCVVASSLDGQANWLCSVWLVEALSEALVVEQASREAGLVGASMRSLTRRAAQVELVSVGQGVHDVDTPEKLAQVREQARGWAP